jgi:Tfp pilus assembly protein PilW
MATSIGNIQSLVILPINIARILKIYFKFYRSENPYMKNREFYKLLKINKSNSGFTLTELLVGLFMSIFVIGALGLGLMTVLATSQSENSKVKARTENSRALDFVSDEVRRARTIETDATNAPRFTISSPTVVLALDIPEISDSATFDSDTNATTKNERIIYYLKSNSGTNWKGPQVLYRWGPPLDANGKYTSGGWTAQALIDGINNTTVSLACATGTVTPANPTGFYACITGTNTAQLFLTGQTKTASGRYDDTQTNDSQVVARARETLAYKTDKNDSITWSVEGLGGEFGCKVGSNPWDMRTDFGNDSAQPDNTTKWIKNRDGSKQPQPIEIDSTKPLTITSSAVGATGCANDDRGNPDTTGDEALSTYRNKISHTINFGNPITFNGDQDGGTYNEPKVKTLDEAVQFLKKGYSIPTTYGGYDADGNGTITIPYDADGNGTITVAEGFGSQDQPSLGRFLYSKGLAIPVTPADISNSTTEFKIPTASELETFLASTEASSLSSAERSKFKLLGDDQRIIAIEVGQIYSDKKNDLSAITGNKNPGFDLQDNIFVVTSDVFKKKFNSNCFPSGCPSTNTNTDTNNTGTGANTEY